MFFYSAKELVNVLHILSQTLRQNRRAALSGPERAPDSA
jgi:hypothetical protein